MQHTYHWLVQLHVQAPGSLVLVQCFGLIPGAPSHLGVSVLSTTNTELRVVKLDLARVGQTGEVDTTAEGLQSITDVESRVLELADAEAGAAVRSVGGDTHEVDLVGDQVANSTAVDARNGVAGCALAGSEQEREESSRRWVGLGSIQSVEVQSDADLDVCVLGADDVLDGADHSRPL